jgi:hypothetical protein
VFLVDTYHGTPATGYREGERLVTETVLYKEGTANPRAIVKAEVFGEKLRNISFSPAPGKAASDPVPDWQISVFRRPNLVQRMGAAGKLLEGAEALATVMSDPITKTEPRSTSHQPWHASREPDLPGTPMWSLSTSTSGNSRPNHEFLKLPLWPRGSRSGSAAGVWTRMSCPSPTALVDMST